MFNLQVPPTPVIGNPVINGTSGSVLFIDANGNLAQDNTNFTYASSVISLSQSGKYGFKNTSGGLAYSGAFGVEILAPDGGAYFMVRNGEVAYNSAKHTYSNAGTPMWTFGLPTADGKINLMNGSSANGVGFDVTTDGTLKIRTRAQTADASLTALTLKATQVAGYVSSDGSTGATGSFTTANSKTVTVKDGIITAIV